MISHSRENVRDLDRSISAARQSMVNGISDVAVIQRQQLNDTSELIIHLQNELEWMIDTKLRERIDKTSDRIVRKHRMQDTSY